MTALKALSVEANAEDNYVKDAVAKVIVCPSAPRL